MRSLQLVISKYGAVAEARISLTSIQRRLMVDAGRLPCPPQDVLLIVDTGSSHSLVDESVMRALSVPSSNCYSYETASTRGVAAQSMAYNVDLQLGSLAQKNLLHIRTLEICAGSFMGATYQGLLGRDVLNRMHLAWRGPSGEAVLQYP